MSSPVFWVLKEKSCALNQSSHKLSKSFFAIYINFHRTETVFRLVISQFYKSIFSAVQLYIKILLEEDIIQERVGYKKKITGLRKQLVMLQADIKKLQERKALFYDKLVEGEISREGYQKSQERLTYQQEEIQRRYNELQKELAHLECITSMEQEGKRHWKEYLGSKELTREILDALIDCIYVKHDGTVHIQWKFWGEMMGER